MKILFKDLPKIAREVIYEYNSIIYTKKMEDASEYLRFQQDYENRIIESYGGKLSADNIKRIKSYIEDHRNYKN